MAGIERVWVFSEKPALLSELAAGAHGLGEAVEVTALVAGPRGEAEAAARNAERVIWLGELPQGRMVEDYVPTLAKLVETPPQGALPPDLLVNGATRRGRAVAGRLAARLGLNVLTDVLAFASNGELQIRHMIFGGGAVRVEKPLKTPVLATVGPGVLEAPPELTARGGEIVEAPFVEPEWRVTLRERKPRKAAAVNLAAARKVVCLGRGVAKKEDLAMIEELAKLLGAEVACTRPLAEGLDWMPRERYIGISGAAVKGDLYLGIGVSGQVQHVIGMNGSRVVAAINKDEHAPIFQIADYGIAGDLYAVVPALIQALKNRG
ncbi:MAG: electron transfer flavoprotein subunit alpha/FixB family protein [Chloroflexi bacterium]|nr:electron transfer flavoprotein subunit alpha/FixB family protein [Chloroflexota bacterium]